MNDAENVSTAELPDLASAHVLLVFAGDGVTRFALPRVGTVLIGRSQDAALRIREPWISREHARLHVVDDEVSIEDLGSANGTTVRDRPLRANRTKLAIGDSFRLGATLVFVARASSEAKTFAIADVSGADRIAELCSDEAHRAAGFTVLALRVFDESGSDVTRHSTRAILDCVGATDSVVVDEHGTHLLPLTRGRARDVTRIAGRIGHSLGSQGLVLHAGSASFPEDATDADGLKRLAQARAAPWRPSRSSSPAVPISEAMLRVSALATVLAGSSIPVVLSGESGTGKHDIAEMLHTLGARTEHPFVIVDAANEIGTSPHVGAGTLVVRHAEALSELGTRAWLTHASSSNARIVFVMTTRDARKASALAAACGGQHVVVPPLRERVSDIESLAHQLAHRAASAAGVPPPRIARSVIEALRGYAFPENVRELGFAMTAAVAVCRGETIELDHLPSPLRATGDARALHTAVENLERERVLGALTVHRGNQVRAAKTLGIARNTLIARMKQFGLGRVAKSA